MSRLEAIHKEITTRYTYNSHKPLQTKEGYWVYQANHNDLKINMTLKIVQSPSEELTRYIRKMKEAKTQSSIKVFELFQNQEGIFFTTEQVTFSNLKFALEKCKKLDDFDAIFLSKVILGAGVDLLRAGINWFGSEEDIEFTDNGLKLSWNNSIPYDSQNSPFPLILSRLAGKLEIFEQKILPFPKSKILQDLIHVSGQNASEISLNPNMKRKEKVSKKKGKDWLALKESKLDFEYYEQTVFFGIHRQIGFCRVKSYNQGKIDEEIMQLNKTKTTFTRVITTYDEQNRTYIISEYSNDGSLYNYVNRLKANSIALKEEQIQFFFYSLFEPLKVIQDTAIKSLCMIHIKNIYIENGIPKIGEPVPLNKRLREELREKADVPDFYHRDFKKSPGDKTNTFDTYSLGVLLYKLMFTQYPIFPQGKVHIPTSPAYNKRLKSTLEIFLNEGGLLKDLEKRISVSDEVAQQVKLNKKKLILQKKQQAGQRGALIEDIEEDELIQHKKKEEDTEGQEEVEIQQDDNEDGCCTICCAQIDEDTKHKNIMLDSLEQSPYSSYRLCTKVICVLSLYIFLFYFFFIQNVFTMMSSQSSLSRLNVTISTVNYEVTVADSNEFFKVFNVTDRSLSSLQKTGCFVNTYNGNPDYSSGALAGSFQVYLFFGLFMMVIILVFKLVQLINFDFIKTLYNMSNLKANFNMSNYLIFNFIFCSFINDHYIFYNMVFNSLNETCLGVSNNYYFGSTHTYFDNPAMFFVVFGLLYLGHFTILLLMLIMIGRTDKVRYTRLFNPILLFLPLLVGYFMLVRVGVISSYFYPSIMKDISVLGSFITSISYINILGIIPEILFLIEFLLEMLVDWIFWLTFDKKRRMLINDISSAGIIM